MNTENYTKIDIDETIEIVEFTGRKTIPVTKIGVLEFLHEIRDSRKRIKELEDILTQAADVWGEWRDICEADDYETIIPENVEINSLILLEAWLAIYEPEKLQEHYAAMMEMDKMDGGY